MHTLTGFHFKVRIQKLNAQQSGVENDNQTNYGLVSFVCRISR